MTGTVEFDIPDIMARVRAGAMRGVVRGTENVRNEAIRLVLDPPKTGAIYDTKFFTIGTGPTRVVVPYGSRPPHQASAPGEAPASDIGRLAGSIDTSYDVPNLTGIVTARTEYAAYLEFGTDRIEPRPFMRVALNTLRASIEADIREEARAALE